MSKSRSATGRRLRWGVRASGGKRKVSARERLLCLWVLRRRAERVGAGGGRSGRLGARGPRAAPLPLGKSLQPRGGGGEDRGQEGRSRRAPPGPRREPPPPAGATRGRRGAITPGRVLRSKSGRRSCDTRAGAGPPPRLFQLFKLLRSV